MQAAAYGGRGSGKGLQEVIVADERLLRLVVLSFRSTNDKRYVAKETGTASSCVLRSLLVTYGLAYFPPIWMQVVEYVIYELKRKGRHGF